MRCRYLQVLAIAGSREIERESPELAALSTKTSKQPLMRSVRVWIPASLMATMNGEAPVETMVSQKIVTHGESALTSSSLLFSRSDQAGTIVRDHHAQYENTADVEKGNPPSRLSDGFWDHLPRLARFSKRQSDHLRSHVYESGVHHACPPAQESTSGSLELVSRERTRIAPVTEPESVALGSSAKVNDETHEHQPHDHKCLDDRGHKLDLSEHPDRTELERWIDC